MNYHFAPDLRRNAEFQAAVDALLRDEAAAAAQHIAPLQRRRAEQPLRRELRPEEIRAEERPLDQARIVAALQRKPMLQAPGGAAELELHPGFVSQPQIFEACRAVALERIVAAHLRRNPAAMMALMWHHATGGSGKKDLVVLPYKDRLLLLGRYLQQLVMESLGKEKDLQGNIVDKPEDERCRKSGIPSPPGVPDRPTP